MRDARPRVAYVDITIKKKTAKLTNEQLEKWETMIFVIALMAPHRTRYAVCLYGKIVVYGDIKGDVNNGDIWAEKIIHQADFFFLLL
jgi:hypothetical protein